MTNIKNQFNAMLIMFVAMLGAFALQASAKDINAYYNSDDGGVYFVRQIGDKIYWFGEDPKGGFANVLMGTVSGNKITAHWWDVPKGKAKGGGDITFEIKGDGASIVKLTSSAPFGMKSLTLGPTKLATPAGNVNPQDLVTPQLRSRPEGFHGDNNLTVAWNGDDYATYYVREMPNGDVVWFAENNLWGDPGGETRPSFARVFVGKKIGGLITGEWVDLPKGKATGNGVLGSKLVNQQEIRFNNPPVGIDGSNIQRSLPNSLRGYADLHAHPMVNLGFGGKFIHGGTDVGSLLPADGDCKAKVRATSISQALGDDKSTHGGYGWPDNQCGDNFRALFIDIFQDMKKGVVTPDHATGYPTFKDYPKWNDLSHQKMWVDWIRRSYNGGQRVMVALATHNSTLAAAVSGPGDAPTDDKASADLQVKEIKDFVGRHNDFMGRASIPAALGRIVLENKMANGLGIRLDNIGNFNKLPNGAVIEPVVSAEITRLFNNGVRYIFPVHVLDNVMGHTAVYEDLFNYSNKRENGSWWDLECAKKEDMISYKYSPLLGKDVGKGIKDLAGTLSGIKVKLDLNSPEAPSKCTSGNRNSGTITKLGEASIKDMWKMGMLVDVDHMSEYSVNKTLSMAEAVPGGFPVVSGHTGLRLYAHSENNRTLDQLERIGNLGGMFGFGSAAVSADSWAPQNIIEADYVNGSKGKGPNANEGRVAFGTDLNGLVKGAPPRAGANIYKDGFQRSKTGDKTWDYRKDGVAHYGMLADFREDLRTVPNHGERVFTTLMKNAEMFARMWEKAEKQKAMVK